MKRKRLVVFTMAIRITIVQIALMALFNCAAYANRTDFVFPPKTITGKITSADGTPLVGASVRVKGSTRGTSTDNSGSFSINVTEKDKLLVISYTGYRTLEKAIGSDNVINISLELIATDLSDVIVVGYGTQKRETVTGSVSTLKSSEIVVTKNENVANMLTGKVPGLRMVQKTAEPGAFENTFDIRGYGAPPLIVIDGVPRGGFEKMDPNEIESISVLKDASAAIYGVRASNGVVLITTKRGNTKDGKFDINYSVNRAWQQFLGMPKSVGAVDFLMLTNEKAKRDFANNFISNAPPVYSYNDIIPWVEGKNVSADWIGAAFNTVAPQVQHNLNITGGTEKISAFFNVGYMKQGGVLKSGDMDYNRWNLRSNINVKITNRLRAQALLSGYIDQKDQPFGDQYTIFKYAWSQVPINQIYANNNPEYLNVMPDNANPVAITDASKVGFTKRTQKNLQAQLNLEYDIPGIKGLKAKGMFNYGYNVDDNSDYRKVYQLYAFNADDSTYKASGVNGGGAKGLPTLGRTYGNNASTLSQLSLNYSNTFFTDHNVSALFLYEQSHYKSDNIFAQRYMPLPVDYLFGGSAGDGESGSTNVNGVAEVATRALVGRVNYDYKGRYLAEFSFRRDGSNKYKPGPNQWGFFPAYLVGWRISEEPLFKDLVSSKIVTNLKLRASYGVLGYDGGTAFQYLSGYAYPTVDPADNKVLGYMINGQFVTGLATKGLANEDLTWYTSRTKNIGLDFTLFKKLLEGSIDVYRRDQKGLTAKRGGQIPGTAGVSLPDENLNGDRVEGWELSLVHKNKVGKVGYSVGGNLSSSRIMDRNVIEGKAGNEYEQWRNSRVNRNKNIWWGTDYGGQFTSYDQIYNYAVNTGGGNNTVVPGDYYFQDWNGDGVINGGDYHPIATFDLPLINYGISLAATYRGIDLTALFAGSAGVYTQYGEQLASPLMYGRSALTKFLDSWHTVNPDDNVYDPNTQWVAGQYPSMGYNFEGNVDNTKAVQSAAYLRLKTLELGYSLPAGILKKAGIKNFRIYVNSYNLFTITGLEGVDPEHPGTPPGGSSNGNFFQYGMGGYKYPLNRTFNAGASISF